MKKLLIISLVALIASCTQPIQKEEFPKVTTTIELQELQKDTVLVTVKDDYLYIFDLEDRLVIYKTQQIGRDSIPVNIFYFMITLVLSMFCIILLITKILE